MLNQLINHFIYHNLVVFQKRKVLIQWKPDYYSMGMPDTGHTDSQMVRRARRGMSTLEILNTIRTCLASVFGSLHNQTSCLYVSVPSQIVLQNVDTHKYLQHLHDISTITAPQNKRAYLLSSRRMSSPITREYLGPTSPGACE